ncbi:hypothetical protein EMIHUDRAFT_120554 [Emiliania huxleyi CCMP1516]|uniref:Fe2OG dioxygenase domain-containing protein n=2 Tax=Emiliania huxleyi TaxID=2903 RepID=A0A0D3IGZ8_EMIH1|nr:hypothetical protein EMIHUDRAFT_120554 [Emiliania huxleyi CCMP1516]EOD10533.1 hypothetical protein EMIHUDRAFT_120554 [Emiliania huxleyi CCMP1516]|eukprot:XP_005762962.1 hypothetical protein EMIHUDRAFT_120554 [Emiliania huxleyi CCMP1516]
MARRMKRPVSRREYWRVRAKARRTRRDAQEVSFDSSVLCQSCGFNVYVHERAVDLSAAQMRTLRGDACALRARHGAASFFLPLSAAVELASEPRHPASPGCSPALLRYVAQLLLSELQDQQDRARLHIAGLLDGGTCGAEFWVQRRAAGEHAINWHWDKDESLLDSSGLTAHPLVSTVTYLTSGGAPTVVLDARTDEHGRLLPPADGSWEGGAIAATVSYPKSRRLLRFDGRLLHGCPPQLAGPEAEPRSHGERLTLLVNVWVGHRPLGLPTAPSEALLRLLRCVPAHSGQVLALDATTPWNCLDVPPARHVGRSSGERLAAPVMGGRAELRFALPKPSTAAEGRGVVTWKDVGVRLEVAQQ